MDMTTLIAALILVESGGQSGLINGDAVGILQIRPIFVEDVNRILGAEVYGPNDRTDPDLSVEMAKVWLTYYSGRIYEYKNLNDNATTMPMYLAIAYNRGYSAMKLMPQEHLIHYPYWKKVREVMEGMEVEA